MELQLKNIGMIKEANVSIDGLTVIAGENDTGKSTVGKIIYSYIETLSISEYNHYRQKRSSGFCNIFNSFIDNIFKASLAHDGNIKILDMLPDENEQTYDEFVFDLDVLNNTCTAKNVPNINTFHSELATIFIESPLVWNFTDFFRDIAQIESQMNIKLDYPYLMKDLNFKLHIKSASTGLDIKDKVTSLMGGEFKKDEIGRYYFDKKGQRIELVNTATGIKYFGIFQILSQNNYLNKDAVLVLDEPEVHLHPKWQLEMAKIIVELVKNGVKIVVNSHSPYMIQALIKYARVEEIVNKTNFYLTEKVDNYANINNVNDELNKIFELLAEPMNQVFEL